MAETQPARVQRKHHGPAWPAHRAYGGNNSWLQEHSSQTITSHVTKTTKTPHTPEAVELARGFLKPHKSWRNQRCEPYPDWRPAASWEPRHRAQSTRPEGI